MRIIFMIGTLLAGQLAMSQDEKKEGWQFYSFFGNYEVVENNPSCEWLNGTVFVGFMYTKNIPSMEIKPRFSTEGSFHTYLRNSKSHGEDCYECDPDHWDVEEIGGDGIKNAYYRNSGVLAYNHRSYSMTIELVRGEGNRVFIKWNQCTATLRKLTENK